MFIVKNNMIRALHHKGTRLLPGTNVVESFDTKNPIVAALIESGDIEVETASKMTDKQKKDAVDKSTNEETLDKLEKTFPGVKTAARRKQIQDFNKDVDDAAEKDEAKEEK